MDMMEFLRTRRTYRRFEQRPVAPEILQECVDAARIASCGANRQTVKYIIVQSLEAVAAVQPLVHWAAYLPREQGNPKADEVPTAFIAVLQDENLPGANDMDAGLALGSLTAAAWAHGGQLHHGGHRPPGPDKAAGSARKDAPVLHGRPGLPHPQEPLGGNAERQRKILPG